jgi:hypothetical protein
VVPRPIVQRVSELINGINANYLIGENDSSNTSEEDRKYRYKKRYKVEDALLKMEQWRGIVTKYCKNVAFFL